MATRKTVSKTTPAKTAKAAAEAASKPTVKTAGRRAAAPANTRAIPARQAAPAAPAAAGQQKVQAPPVEVPAGEARYRWIAHAAYLRAEKRGFAPGREIDDWLAAEAEFVAAFRAS